MKRKLVGILLVLVLCLALAAPAFAEPVEEPSAPVETATPSPEVTMPEETPEDAADPVEETVPEDVTAPEESSPTLADLIAEGELSEDGAYIVGKPKYGHLHMDEEFDFAANVAEILDNAGDEEGYVVVGASYGHLCFDESCPYLAAAPENADVPEVAYPQSMTVVTDDDGVTRAYKEDGTLWYVADPSLTSASPADGDAKASEEVFQFLRQMMLENLEVSSTPYDLSGQMSAAPEDVTDPADGALPEEVSPPVDVTSPKDTPLRRTAVRDNDGITRIYTADGTLLATYFPISKPADPADGAEDARAIIQQFLRLRQLERLGVVSEPYDLPAQTGESGLSSASTLPPAKDHKHETKVENEDGAYLNDGAEHQLTIFQNLICKDPDCGYMVTIILPQTPEPHFWTRGSAVGTPTNEGSDTHAVKYNYSCVCGATKTEADEH